jgi:hypothetical protein
VAIERIQIGNLVLEKTIIEPEEAKEEKEPEVRAVSGHKAREARELKPGASGRIARGGDPSKEVRAGARPAQS